MGNPTGIDKMGNIVQQYRQAELAANCPEAAPAARKAYRAEADALEAELRAAAIEYATEVFACEK